MDQVRDNTTPRRRSAGFTLIELLVVIALVMILAAMVFVAVGQVIRMGRMTAEQQMLRSLKGGVEQFRQNFGFLPPLIEDQAFATLATSGDSRAGPVYPTTGTTANPRQPVAFLTSSDPLRLAKERNWLQGRKLSDTDDPSFTYTPADESVQPRYSLYSLPYYILAALDVPRDSTNISIDGAGAGKFARVLPDGTFDPHGPQYEPMLTLGQNAERIRRYPQIGCDPSGPKDGTNVTFVDRWNQPIRFYRWQPTVWPKGSANQGQVRPLTSTGGGFPLYNVPWSIGDPTDPSAPPALRTASYAIVSGGPNLLIDDTKSRTSEENKDNLVELGE